MNDAGAVIVQFYSRDYPDWSAYAATSKFAEIETDQFDFGDSCTFEVPSNYSHHKAYKSMFDALYFMAFNEEEYISPRIAFEQKYSLNSLLASDGKVLTKKEKVEAEKDLKKNLLSAYKDIVPQSIIPIRDRLFCTGSLYSVQINSVCIIRIVEKEIKKRGGGTLDISQSWADYIIYVRDETDLALISTFAQKHGIEMLEFSDLLCSLANTPELSEEEQSKQLTEYEFSEKKKAEKRARIAAEKLGKKCLHLEKLRLELEEEEKRRQELRRQRDAETLRRLEEKEKERLEKEQLKRQEAERRRQEAEAREQLRKAAEAADRERRIRESDICRPGEEPANIRRRIDILFPKLDAAYPDRVISGLNKDHKKWGETVTELYRALGYPDSRAFLEAYGYTVAENRGGRPSTVDPAAVIKTLCERYPQGAGNVNVAILKADNPDLPLKSLENNAAAFFGCAFGYYLTLPL